MIHYFKLNRKFIKLKLILKRLNADFLTIINLNRYLFLELYFLTLYKNPASF